MKKWSTSYAFQILSLEAILRNLYARKAKPSVKTTKMNDLQSPRRKLATVARAEKAVKIEKKMLMKKKGEDISEGSLE
jgi:hypothetical protein